MKKPSGIAIACSDVLIRTFRPFLRLFSRDMLVSCFGSLTSEICSQGQELSLRSGIGWRDLTDGCEGHFAVRFHGDGGGHVICVKGAWAISDSPRSLQRILRKARLASVGVEGRLQMGVHRDESAGAEKQRMSCAQLQPCALCRSTGRRLSFWGIVGLRTLREIAGVALVTRDMTRVCRFLGLMAAGK